MIVKGIDVGISQGAAIDWEAEVAATGIRFAMIRSGNGNDSPDPTFRAHVEGAKNAGVAVGAYHVAFPLPHIDPIANARTHYDQALGLGAQVGELPPALDVEWPLPAQWARYGCGAAQIRAWLVAYLEECARLHECTPMLYTYWDYWVNLLAGPLEPRFARFLLWQADYQSPPGTMGHLAPWATAIMRQTSGGKSARLPGGVPVDEDILPDEATLQALLLGP